MLLSSFDPINCILRNYKQILKDFKDINYKISFLNDYNFYKIYLG